MFEKIKIVIAQLLGAVILTGVLSAPAFADPTSLSDSDMSKITGASNDYSIGQGAIMNIVNQNSRATVSFGSFQWSDDHSHDTSDHKGANDQSGTNSNVQGTVNSLTNAIAWGSVAQSVLNNTGVTKINGPETNMAYAVFAVGGF